MTYSMAYVFVFRKTKAGIGHVHGLFCIPLSISALCIFLPVIMLMIVTGEIKVYERCVEPHVTQEIRFKH